MTSRKNLIVALALLALGTSGCAERSTLGNAIAAEGAEIAAIGDKWSKGEDLIEKGEGQVEDGNEMIDDGRELIETGRANVELGQKMKAEAEKEYTARTGKKLPTPQ